MNLKVEGKDFPVHVIKADSSIHSQFWRHIGLSGQNHAPAALPPRNNRRLSRAQKPSGRF